MSVPPGWYKDPADPTVQRWWDGEGWVGPPLPADATPPPGPPEASPAGMELPVPGMAGTELPHWSSIPPHVSRRHPDPATTPPPPRVRPHVAGAGELRTVPPGLRGRTLARPGTRLLARLVDLALLFGLNVLVNGWFVYRLWQELAPTLTEAWSRAAVGDTSTDGIPPIGERAPDLMLTILAIATALWLAYEVPAVANTGQTIGKRLLRIQVVRLESTDPLTIGRSFRRWNTMGFPTLLWYCFGIGLVLQLVDALLVPFDQPLHQALHDKSANTIVVAVPEPTTPPSPEEATR